MVEMIKTRINGRWDIMLPKHRADRPEWYTIKGWERERLGSMYLHLNPISEYGYGSDNEVMYYVGAEEGDMAALCQMWGAEVLLFEPNDLVWPNLQAIWDANNLETPWCFNGFASNITTPGAAITHGFPSSAHGPIISDHGFKELISAGDIPQTKIDDVNFKPPTAISIDVEGSEWEVLRGAEQTLRKYHPKIWLSLHPEFMYEKYKEYGADLRQWVKELGYKETLLAYDHEVHLFYEPIEKQS